MQYQEFIDRYQYKVKEDKLGGGGLGTVYKVYDRFRHKWVAIKIAEQKTIQGKTISLHDELATSRALPDHPNIAYYREVHTFETPQGVFDYAIMQYYPDGNLKGIIEKGGLSSR